MLLEKRALQRENSQDLQRDPSGNQYSNDWCMCVRKLSLKRIKGRVPCFHTGQGAVLVPKTQIEKLRSSWGSG